MQLFNKQYTNTVQHKTSHTNRKTDRATKQLHCTPLNITTADTQNAIKKQRNNNSTGPDNINIRHLKHLGPIATTLLTHIYNTALNTNIIPHIWKTAKVIPIPKHGKDPTQGTSYRPIALLSPIAKTLEKILLPHITSNITPPTHQHGFRAKHSTTTALHNINNTITKGFNQKQPPERTIAVALDMSKAFDTVHHHKLIDKLHNTNIPNTITKFVANYIKGRKQYVLYNNTASRKRNTKTGVPQGGVLSPTLFNIYMADMPTPQNNNIKLITYADDITILSTHRKPDTAQAQVQPYLTQVYRWTQNNQLTLNASKTTSTLFTPDPAEYNKTLELQINNTQLPTVKEPKILGLTLDPKLTYTGHVRKTVTKAKNTLKALKALTTTHWGKSKETLLVTYKTITRPILEYANTIWSPIISQTNTQKLQTVQNTALRTVTGCTLDTNAEHLHSETLTLPLREHFKLHSSQLRQLAQDPEHTLHHLTQQEANPRHKKQTPFDNNNNYTYNLDTPPQDTNPQTIEGNKKRIHTHFVETFTNAVTNKILNANPPPVDPSEKALPHSVRRTLAQLRTNKSPFLRSYLNKISPETHTPGCPLCPHNTHDTQHLFTCPAVPTDLGPEDLWTNPAGAAELLARWGDLEGGGQGAT